MLKDGEPYFRDTFSNHANELNRVHSLDNRGKTEGKLCTGRIPPAQACAPLDNCFDARRFRAESTLQFFSSGLLLLLPVPLFPQWVLIRIGSYVGLLLSQQPDKTHGIYLRRRLQFGRIRVRGRLVAVREVHLANNACACSS